MLKRIASVLKSHTKCSVSAVSSFQFGEWLKEFSVGDEIRFCFSLQLCCKRKLSLHYSLEVHIEFAYNVFEIRSERTFLCLYSKWIPYLLVCSVVIVALIEIIQRFTSSFLLLATQICVVVDVLMQGHVIDFLSCRDRHHHPSHSVTSGI